MQILIEEVWVGPQIHGIFNKPQVMLVLPVL